MPRRLGKISLFLGLGLATSFALALILAATLDVTLGVPSQAQSFVDDADWSVTRYDRWGALAITSVRARGLSWSPQQAAGPPDTFIMGDQTTAWASQSQDGAAEWLVLEYATPVIPRRVDVYENYCPGALARVTIFDAADHEIDAWTSDASQGIARPAPLTQRQGQSVAPAPAPAPAQPAAVTLSGPVKPTTLPIALDTPTKKIKLYLASDKVPGWNEIDAVGLVSDKGDVQWARRVKASSTYASSSGGARATTGQPEQLIPAWCDLARPTRANIDGGVNREDRQVDARGWPMVAFYSRRDSSTPSLSTSAYPATYSGSSMALTGTSLTYTSPVVSGSSATVALPLRPIWWGLAADTVFFATAWLIVWTVLTVPRRFVREVARIRRGGCMACGYDLGYDFIKGCPECGWRRDRPADP